MKKKFSTLLTLLVLTFCTSIAYGQSAIHWFSFDGKVAGSNVSGGLTLYAGGGVDGQYGYSKFTRTNPNAVIDLRGSWRKTGSSTYALTLTEYGRGGHVSGTWNVTFNESSGKISGSMRNSKGKTYKVSCSCYWD